MLIKAFAKIATPRPSGQELIQWQAIAAEYRCLDEMVDEFKTKIAPLLQQQAAIEKGFIDLMGDFAQAESGGLRISRYIQQGNIDYKAALMLLHPDVDPAFLETFRKKSSERIRITLKDEDKATVPFSIDEIMSAIGSDFWF